MKHLKVYESVVGSKNRMNEAQMTAATPAEASRNLAQVSRLIGELSKGADRIAGGNPTEEEVSVSAAIVDCIKSNNFTHLSFLTTGAGSYALGMIAALISSGVGTIPGLVLGMAGMIIMVLDVCVSYSLDDGGVAKEVDDLLACLEKKGVI